MTVHVVSTRYGAAAVDALAAAVAAAKRGEPLRPVTVVVPSNYAGVAARRALARRGGVIGVSFVTLYRLAELLGGPTLVATGRVPVSSPVVATAVRAVLATQPGLFAPVAQQPATIEALRRVHRELRDLTEVQLDHLARAEPRAAAVVAIDRAVTQRLRDGWFDESDLLATATEEAQAGPKSALGPVIVHLPQRIGASASRLLLALGERGSVTVVAGLTGHAVADRAVTRWLVDLGLEPAEPPATATATAPIVEQVVAADPDDEVRVALRRVIQAAEAGTPLERIVVCYAPGAPYGRLLTDHLGAAHLPWNGVATVALTERVAGRAVTKAIDLGSSGVPRHELFTLLSSLPPLRRRPVAAWERHSRRAGVVAGPAQWDDRLGRLADELQARTPDGVVAAAAALAARADGGLGASPDDDPLWSVRQAEEVEALRAFVAELFERLRPPVAATWDAHARWARRLQEHLLGPSSARTSWRPDEERAAERVERALDRLQRLDAVAGIRVDGAVFRAALEAELEQGVITVGRLGEGLFVGPIPLAVGIDADLVVVLGLIEGSLPGGLGDDPLLSERSRAAVGTLATAAERRDALHHQLLAVTGAAARVVVASRPRADLRTGTARYRSRWADSLLALGPAGPSHNHLSFPEGLDDDLPAASEQEALLADLRHLIAAGLPAEAHPVALADSALRGALALVQARASSDLTEYDGNLAPLAAEGAVLPVEVASATALEVWARCPYAYFLRHVLDIREVDNPEDELSIRPTDRGNLVHSVLEDFVADALAAGITPEPGGLWSDAALTKLGGCLQARTAEAVRRGQVGRALHWRLDERRLWRLLDVFVELDGEARLEHGVRPVAVELEFGRERPFTLQLPSGRALRIRGKVDRVDASADRVLVVDYKTGAKRSGKDTNEPVRLQLPIYGLAARQQLGLPNADVIGEYWHLHVVPKKRGRLVYVVDALEEQRLVEVLEAIVDGIEGGLFVAHPDPPDPWRPWVSCTACDPDGAGTATGWATWQRKRAAPELARYRQLVEAEENDEEEEGLT